LWHSCAVCAMVCAMRNERGIVGLTASERARHRAPDAAPRRRRTERGMTERAMTERSTTTSGAVQSVDRAVLVLETIAREDGATVAEIARDVEVDASAASRVVASLERHDLVERGDAGAVQLGVGLLRLASAARPRRDLTAIAGPVCEALAEELGETVNVAVNLYQAQARSTVAMHNWVGDRTVLHATSSGKMLLAHLDPAQRRELLRGELESFTARTLTD